MMYQKAKLFSDEEAANAILKMPTPRYETPIPSLGVTSSPHSSLFPNASLNAESLPITTADTMSGISREEPATSCSGPLC